MRRDGCRPLHENKKETPTIMAFRWIFNQAEDEEAVSGLQEQLGVSETIARLLSIRGITTYEEARTFFRPDINNLHDPFLMQGMNEASQRVADAIRNCESVVVYGDYDVDGTTATALMYTFLKDFGVDVHYYIPHRFKEGYGLSREGIEFAAGQNAALIISVDCGISAFEEAQWAKDHNLDLVICDHHNAGDYVPDAYAVLDPKRGDCEYPFDGLSGAGVGFKLIQGTLSRLGLPVKTADRFLDLVAISIASDIVPIVDENRVLMRAGLTKLNEEPNLGIKALMDLIQLNAPTITTSHIVFSIGPRINAAGRMGDAAKAVELLITDNAAEAEAHAHELEAINIRRKATDSDTMRQAVRSLEKDFDEDEMASVVLHDPEWHLGVIGIVASRIVDLYCRPTIMLSTVEGQIKGSARSIKGFNVYEALKECGDLLDQFGGHEYAAGISLTEENLPAFMEKFNRIANQHLSSRDFQPELPIDAELELRQITQKFWNILRQFEPFGPGNMKPVFFSRNLDVQGTPTVVGSGHLKLRVSQNGSPSFDAIGFNMHDYLPAVRNCGKGGLHLAYVLEENTWNNRTQIQMRVKDIKTDESELPEYAGELETAKK